MLKLLCLLLGGEKFRRVEGVVGRESGSACVDSRRIHNANTHSSKRDDDKDNDDDECDDDKTDDKGQEDNAMSK